MVINLTQKSYNSSVKYHVLAIGVSKQQNSAFNSLDFADKDAEEFYSLFTSNVSNLGYVKLLKNNEATLAAIRSALGTELLQQVSSEDAFFFLFSGHGAVAPDQEGQSLAHYLAPYDATDDYTSSCVSVDYIKDFLDNLPCKSSFVFIDSCFSGGLNKKSLPFIKRKELKGLKSFNGVDLGDGNVVFTACKDTETAIEDPEKKNGLFTYALLSELQKSRANSTYPVEEIFTPIMTTVTQRAKDRWNETQTPTVRSHLQGKVTLPVFKNPINIPPTLIKVPQPELTQLSSSNYQPPRIEVADKVQEDLINKQIALITTNKLDNPAEEAIFERFCWQLVNNSKEEWEKIFLKAGGLIPNIPPAVTELEAASYQLILLGGIVAVFGRKKHMKLYSEAVATILNWEYGKAGLTALIAAPEILLVLIINVVGVLSLARNNLDPLITLLNEPIPYEDSSKKPRSILTHYYIHYCDALGGTATKVGDHVREMLKTYSWIPSLVPKIEGKIEDYQLRVNFLLVMKIFQEGEHLYPDFGRFYSNRLKPLADKITYHEEFQKQLASWFGLDVEQTRQFIINTLEELMRVGLGGGYFWQSIRPKQLLTEKEIEQQEKEAVKTE